jgi:hypothetical protein
MNKPPSKKLQKRADKFIAVLEGFKQGKPLQRKTRELDWHDFDLTRFIDDGAVIYRVKP